MLDIFIPPPPSSTLESILDCVTALLAITLDVILVSAIVI